MPRYEVFGPFPFDTSNGQSHGKALEQFWDDRRKDGSPEDLCDTVGVYVWTIKKNGKRIPWNVGLTDRQGFKRRFKQKENGFLRFRLIQPDAKFEVYLLVLRSNTGRPRRATQSKAGLKVNNWLETMLIGSSITVNPDLRNKAKVKYLQTTTVDGYLNDKEETRSQAAKSFNALFKAQRGKRK
jgi:hypothetical protein